MMTRAHLFLILIEKFVPGGWLAFLNFVKLKEEIAVKLPDVEPPGGDDDEAGGVFDPPDTRQAIASHSPRAAICAPMSACAWYEH